MAEDSKSRKPSASRASSGGAKAGAGKKPAAKKSAPRKPAAKKAAPTRKAAAPEGSAAQKEMPPTSETPAPSIGPHTEIEKEAPEERLSRHEQSDVDAMGLDKRRPVIGGSYSASLARQATIYGIFLAVLAAIVFVAILAVDELDKPPETYKDEAPWANSQRAPAAIDFPEYGDAAQGPQP